MINISSGKRYRTSHIIKLIQKISQKKFHYKINNTTPDEKCIWANNFKAKKLLKFEPKTSIKEGLGLTFKNLKE